jgi:putative tricarboxylic transport membrane protein
MKKDRIFLFLWLLFCVFFAIESWRLGLGRIRAPGPGFLPFWVSVIVGILTIIELVRGIMGRFVGEVQPLFRGKRVRNTVYAGSFLFAYPLLIERIGFFFCTLFFTGSCLRLIGKKKWFAVFAVSILASVGSYALFVVWLKIQFPVGKWVEPFFPV